MPRGRPKKLITQKELNTIATLAGYGLSEASIAASLGMHPDTFTARKKEDIGVEAALLHGKAKIEGKVAGALVRKACKGDVNAIRWFEATRHGRSEKHVVENRDGSIEDLIRAAQHGATADPADDDE